MDRAAEASRLESVPFIAGGFEESQAEHLARALEHVRLPGPWLEFGVWKGTTARFLLGRLPAGGRLHLFDSFRGLPEDWKEGFPQGEFALPGPERPRFDDPRVELVQGFFEDTLPAWARAHTEPAAFLFVDCDLYSSTQTIFRHLHHLIVPGTVIVFDEYHVPELDGDELRAWLEFAAEHEVDHRYLARAQNGSVSLIIE